MQVQVWCGATLMQNMVVAAPLLTGTLHFDMEAMTDTSLVRVTVHIPGGNTLNSSRVLRVTCPRTMLEIWALSALRSRFCDLREVGFRVIPVHPAVTWNAPILPLHKEKMVLIYEDVVLQLDAVVLLKMHLPLFMVKELFTAPVDSVKRIWSHNLDYRSLVLEWVVNVCAM